MAEISDYISREAFKGKYLCCGYLPEMPEKEFDEFPAADVEPVRHGRWQVVYPDGTFCKGGSTQNHVCLTSLLRVRPNV